MGPSYGGPFHSVRRLAQEQALAGWDVSVRMPWSQEAENHQQLWKPAKCEIRGCVSIKSIGWSQAVSQELPQADCEILHTHGLWMHSSWVALAWKRRWHRPHVASARGMLEAWAWNHHAWKKRPMWWLLEKRNLESASLLHATSHQEAQSFRNRGLKAPIAIIPNGVDIPMLPLSEERQSPKQIKTALFLSRLHPKKGLPLLIEAWSKIRPRDWQLRIAGPDEGGHQAVVEKMVNSAGLAQEIVFLGALEGQQKARAFFESDLFILPSHSENFGISVAEALAHGLPVITTQGTPWQSLETERCGWWVPVSIEGLATALKMATQLNEVERSEMGSRGRQWMENQFGWPQVASQMIMCYDWLLRAADKPVCIV
jgi:glycosyltransferase involved in cell wall biosynthesis